MINLRLGTHHQNTAGTERLLEQIRKYPGCCDRVWFSTLYGYPLLETHQQAAEEARSAAQEYRKNKITVDLQISNTIGHGEYMKNRDNSGLKAYDLEPLVGHDAAVAEYCFCWRGEKFLKYIQQMVSIYVQQLMPDTVWIDDDLRPDNHYPVTVGCFCDNCIAEFCRIYGCTFTRKELVEEINMGSPEWRERWIQFTRAGIRRLAGVITDAVLAISPNSRMALQHGLFSNLCGRGRDFVFDELNRAHRAPASRAGAGAYHDKAPYALLEKQITLTLASDCLPPYVEYRVPEIENLPYVIFGKSNYGTMLESSLALAYGSVGLSYATMMQPYEEDSFFEEQLSLMSQHRRYWRRLIETNRVTYSGNIGIVSGSWRQSKDPTGEFHYGDISVLQGTSLTRIGLAESHEQTHAPVFALFHKVVDNMTDEEIEQLFQKPVITDAMAVDKLEKRGFGGRLPITVKKIEALSFREQLPGGKIWSTLAFGREAPLPYVIEGKSEPLGRLINGVTKEDYGVSAAVVSFEKAKWAIFGYSIWNDIISTAKRNQILDAINRIAVIPAYIKTAAQVTTIARVDSCGRTAAVSVVNISISPTPPLELQIHRPAGRQFIFQNAEMIQQLCAVDSENGVQITLPPFLRGWDIATVFIE
jgi:hypothetical protein